MTNSTLAGDRVQQNQWHVWSPTWSSLSGDWCSIRHHSIREVTPGSVISAVIALRRGPATNTWERLITSLLWLHPVYHQHQPHHLRAPGFRATIPFICPDVTTHCRQCSKPSICSWGLLAGQVLPPCPSTHAPSQARLSLPSWGFCQEREVLSCRAWVQGKGGLEGGAWDDSGTLLCLIPVVDIMCIHSANITRPGCTSCCHDSPNTWPWARLLPLPSLCLPACLV